MFDVQNLYRDMIIDHNRSPQNFGVLQDATHSLEGFNPLCGDRLVLYLFVVDNDITKIAFSGEGCAISVASASLMTEIIKGRTMVEAETLFAAFHRMLTTEEPIDIPSLGKLAALAGVRNYPTRVKCATLCWHTLEALLRGDKDSVSTE